MYSWTAPPPFQMPHYSGFQSKAPPEAACAQIAQPYMLPGIHRIHAAVLSGTVSIQLVTHPTDHCYIYMLQGSSNAAAFSSAFPTAAVYGDADGAISCVPWQDLQLLPGVSITPIPGMRIGMYIPAPLTVVHHQFQMILSLPN